MPLEQFNLLKSQDKRLLQYDDAIYKIQIVYVSSEELQKLPCSEEIAHKQIEDVIKACIYSAKTQPSQNIQTSHFKVSCAFREWQAGKKLKFVQNGIEMNAHSHMLVIKVEPLDNEFMTHLSSPKKRIYIEDQEHFQKNARKSPRLSNTKSNDDRTTVTHDKMSDKEKKKQSTHKPSQQPLSSFTEQYPLQHSHVPCERTEETDSTSRIKSSHKFRLKEVCLDNRNNSSTCKRKIIYPTGDEKKKRKRSNDRLKKHNVQMDIGRENTPSHTSAETDCPSAVFDIHLGDNTLNLKDNDPEISVVELGNREKRRSFFSTALSVLVTPVKKLFGK